MRCPHKRTGQSMVELSFVFLAVIAGIVMGGPYLLDSINSHFKLWDTSVADSNHDRLVQAGNADINSGGISSCVQAGPPAAGSCGTRACGNDPTLRYYTWQYSPVGCQVKFSCDKDDTCCGVPRNTSTCWRVGDPNNAVRVWALPSEIPSDVSAQGFHSCAPGGSTCVNGDILYDLPCGSKTFTIALSDPANCRPTCNWNKLPANATPCPGQGQVSYMPASKDPDLLLPTDLCNCDPGACQAKCAAGTFPLGSECVCSCPAGQAAVRTCGQNSCYQGSCPAGSCSVNMDVGCLPTPATCGSNGCEAGENCTNCPQDCPCGG